MTSCWKKLMLLHIENEFLKHISNKIHQLCTKILSDLVLPWQLCYQGNTDVDQDHQEGVRQVRKVKAVVNNYLYLI